MQAKCPNKYRKPRGRQGMQNKLRSHSAFEEETGGAVRLFIEFPFFWPSSLPLGILKRAELGGGLSSDQRFRHPIGQKQRGFRERNSCDLWHYLGLPGAADSSETAPEWQHLLGHPRVSLAWRWRPAMDVQTG